MVAVSLNTLRELFQAPATTKVMPHACRDARIAFFNIHILSISVKKYAYPYLNRSDAFNCYPYPIHIRSIDRESEKLTPDIFSCSCNTGCPIAIPPVVFGTDVDVAYFLMFATITKNAKAIYLSQIAQKRK